MSGSIEQDLTDSGPRLTVLGYLRQMLPGRRLAVAALGVASLLAGVTESAILAVLAAAATALAKHSGVHLNAGPVHVDVRLGVLLAFAFGLALLRLGLQFVISIVPGRIIADVQARLREEVFAAFTRASWSEQSRDREGLVQELLTNHVGATIGVANNATMFMIATVTFLVLVATALTLNIVAALVVLVAAVGLAAMLRPVSKRGHRQGRALSRESLGFAAGINETVR